MATPSSTIRYVDDAHASARFYGKLLGAEPSYDAPVFASIPIAGDLRLAFWNRDVILPPIEGKGSEGELCLSAKTPDELDRLWAGWKDDGIAILQDPVDLPFGRTFTAADPDGHRIRVLYREG